MNTQTEVNLGIWSDGDSSESVCAPPTLQEEMDYLTQEELKEKADEASGFDVGEEKDNSSNQVPEESTEETANESADENKKRAEHEAAEARRKEEWEAKQQAKKAAEQEAMNRLAAMTDEDVMIASMKRVSAETERLTRRNMKDCVSEHIQTKCLEDPSFARLTMHPRKTMIHCFRYINRKAFEFIRQEREDNDIRFAGAEEGYDGDVPDDMCYQWAEDYFRELDAEEDKEKEEKFVPKYYCGTTSAKPKKAAEKKQSAKKTAEKKPEKEPSDSTEQLSFVGQLSLFDVPKEAKAG